MSDQRQLGKIDDVNLTIEDHGILTLQIGFDFGGTHQGFGGYCLDTYNKETDRREGHASGTDFILRLLKTFGVSKLSDIEGKPAYALRDDRGVKIIGIETPEFDGSKKFLIEDWRKRWFPETTKEDFG